MTEDEIDMIMDHFGKIHEFRMGDVSFIQRGLLSWTIAYSPPTVSRARHRPPFLI